MHTKNGQTAMHTHSKLHQIDTAVPKVRLVALLVLATALSGLLIGCGQEARSETEVPSVRGLPELTEHNETGGEVAAASAVRLEDEEARWAAAAFPTGGERLRASESTLPSAEAAESGSLPPQAQPRVVEPQEPAPVLSRSAPPLVATDQGEGQIIEPKPSEDDLQINALPEGPMIHPTPEVIVRAGQQLVFATETELSTKDNQIGDVFYAYLADDLVATDGMVLLPRGLRARGIVIDVVESRQSDELPSLELRIEELIGEGGNMPVEARVISADFEGDARDSDGESVVKVLTGAAAGAILGRILGGDDGDAVKGGVAGAAAGAAVAYGTRGGHAKLPAGAQITIELEQPLSVF